MLLKNKSYWMAAVIILIVSLLKPIAVEQTNVAYEYKFGVLFPFLSLRLDGMFTGYQNVFNIVSQSYSYELNIAALIGAVAVCFVIAYVLIKVVVGVFGGK